MTIDTHIYYLPFYFQVIKGTSAANSGIRILPYFVSVTMSAVVTGSCVTAIGIYVPFMWLGSIMLTVGSALLHLLNTESTTSRWIGYQLLTGIGFGMAFQVPYTALHATLSPEDLPIGNSLIVFFQALGGAVAVSAAQNILSHTLLQRLELVSGVDPKTIIATGPTMIRSVVPPGLTDTVVRAYSYSLSEAFLLPVTGAGACFLCSLAMEWKSVKSVAHPPAE